MNRRALYGLLFAILAFAFLFPLFRPSDFVLHIMVIIFINILLTTSWAMILRMGYLSFAQATFMGIGAYGSALLMMKGGFPFWLSLPCGGLLAAVMAAVIGFPFFRVKGIYFAMLTFAFAEVVRLVMIRWKTLTKGATGLHGIPIPDPISLGGSWVLHFDSKVVYYYVALMIITLCLYGLYRIVHSRFGFMIFAMAASESLLESVGINTLRYRIQAFAVSAFFAGIAGAVYAHFIRLAFPNSFSATYSIELVSQAIVGGAWSFWGPMVGSVFLTFCAEYFFSATGFYSSILMGAFLIVTILLFPEGMVSIQKKLIPILRKRKGWNRGLGSDE